MPHKRYQIRTRDDHADTASTLDDALQLAIAITQQHKVTAWIYDNMAQPHQPDLWEVRPGESFTRPLRRTQRIA